nr:immunoglobulin heavy chain junction region [Mus musculus]NSM04632.1 immunoglobulin heavy chain junction region [Mus musculus]NSM05743.1 immunoglobulin heavy chain junction region [Mus musculus]NSM08530.1 immunoglobulin heavy chain junction region [Mus musculus]NSM09202.1 immunoglobulin heavy chain junction region [Mus musculus]
CARRIQYQIPGYFDYW